MKIPIDTVKELRNRTSAGIAECNNVLSETGGDIEKALEILKQRGEAIAENKKGRIAAEGVVEAYIHHNMRIGVLVELNCETDFVARTPEFKEIARDLAMQVAATAPQFISEKELPPESEMDPQTVCLLSQPFIKDPTKTIEELITETIAKVGENIKVRKFTRFELGIDY